MGSSMGPVLANIIMTELEQKVITKLINDGTIKFYGRYVDDTLLVIKSSDLTKIHELMNAFDKNIQFTVDNFDQEIPHFLDLEIAPDGLSIFRKDTNTGQYSNFNSYEDWKFRTAWIRSLVNRAKRICSDCKLKQELSKIRKFASWNSFPCKISNSIIKTTLDKVNCQ
uniref:Reverse transcriptase domain-containing protein n=1 Tax=Clytia hemisphaerica TaxID=252671 RepID=A0A7M5XL39_9CNID